MPNPLHFLTLVPQLGLETVAQFLVASRALLNRFTCTNEQVFTVFGIPILRVRAPSLNASIVTQ